MNAPSEKPVLLVVDDEIALQSLVSDMLDVDYTILTAINGQDGVEKARTKHPAAILMDVMMPDMGGFEAVRLLLGDPITRDIPVIFISAHTFDTTTMKMMKEQPNVKGFVTKPFHPKELRQLIQSSISKTS